MDNKQQLHEEESVYNKIQWMAETLHDQALFKFYESCMLEPIRNAVLKFTKMGVLNKKEVPKKNGKVVTFVYQLSPEY